MNIRYNSIDKTQAHELVTFSNIPAILEVSDVTGGTKATLQLTVQSEWSATTNNQWWLTFQGDTISNVLEPKNAVNKNFYISDRHSTAVSIANALRNCPTVAASFLVYADEYKVIAKAREIGAIDLTVTKTEGMTGISVSSTAGTAYSTLNNSKIMVDVYSNDDYITSLEKNYYGGECRFDMTPVLSTLAEYNLTVPYSMNISSMNSSGTVSTLGSVTGNSVSVGYMVNQGEKYLELDSYITIAQNVSRGKLRNAYNNSLLYVYENVIPISFYTTLPYGVNQDVSISYLDSTFNQITSSTQTVSIVGPGFLHTVTVNLSIPANCFYIDVTIGNNRLRYNVIRPMKSSYGCQRVYWINSYGGTSFFDFVGQKTIENTSDTVTYNKNNLDYYSTGINEKELSYDIDTQTTYTLKSHLIEEDGKWQLYDLLQSPRAWTNINGQDYVVIIESVSAAEQNSQQIYEMTVKFRISQPTSL